MKCVDILVYYSPQKLFLFNDELWVGAYNKGVFVYNLDFKKSNQVKHPQFHKVTGVLKTATGVIVCDCSTGVHHLNHQGHYTNLICSGCFSDACLTSDNKIYALEYKIGEFIFLSEIRTAG